jgi:hypothetical protein
VRMPSKHDEARRIDRVPGERSHARRAFTRPASVPSSQRLGSLPGGCVT